MLLHSRATIMALVCIVHPWVKTFFSETLKGKGAHPSFLRMIRLLVFPDFTIFILHNYFSFSLRWGPIGGNFKLYVLWKYITDSHPKMQYYAPRHGLCQSCKELWNFVFFFLSSTFHRVVNGDLYIVQHLKAECRRVKCTTLWGWGVCT